MRAQKRAATARRMATADPTVNIAADENDHVASGYGVCHAPGRENESISIAGATAIDLATETVSYTHLTLPTKA